MSINILRKNSHNAHILIVGSGIVGKFSALELSNLGFRITIADNLESKSCSRASLGILMGKIYQKRRGRSWLLRKESISSWQNWLKILKKYNHKLKIEKPLFQLTTDTKKFERLKNFVINNPNDNLEVLEKDSNLLKNVQNIFKENQIRGIISYDDGRINPTHLLNTINIYLKKNNVEQINEEIIKIQKEGNHWIAVTGGGEEIYPQVIILCNSLNIQKLIDLKKFDIKFRPVLGQGIELLCKDELVDFSLLPRIFSINGKNLIPVNSKQIIIGSTDEISFTPKKEKIKDLLRILENNPSWLSDKNIIYKWHGIRSMPEGEPSPMLRSLEKGLIICTGFYKNGILLSPACAKWLKNEIFKHV